MELLLLGTAAAEGWPCPFCDCDVCVGARRYGGRDIRTRSGALIDNVLKVDYGPDTVMQVQRANRDLRQITTLVFTHAHDDHFIPIELQYRKTGFIKQPGLPLLHVYGNQEVMSKLHALFPKPDELRAEFHEPLQPHHSVTSPDGTTILPLPANHAPGAFLLRITRNSHTLLYGHDSGTYPEETIVALAKEPLNIALFDCTYGGAPNDGRNHLGVQGVLETVQRLRSVGAVTPKTQLIATHFSHNSGGLLYNDLVTQLEPHHVHVAYDGMIVDY